MKPRKSRRPEASQVGKHDMKEVLEKGQVELKSERIGGLGYTPVKQLDVVEQALVFHPERHCERSRSPRQRKTQPANISRSGDYSDRSEHRAERYSHEDMSYRRRRRMDPPSYDRQTVRRRRSPSPSVRRHRRSYSPNHRRRRSSSHESHRTRRRDYHHRRRRSRSFS